MSIFPKRLHYGDDVIIHLAFGLKFLKEGLHVIGLDINVIDPVGKQSNICSKIFRWYKGSDEAERMASVSNADIKYKYVPLHLLGKYFSSKSPVSEVIAILNSVSNGKHFYFTYKLPKDALPGKYVVDIVYHINGEPFYSRNKEDDFFYLEDLTLVNTKDGLYLLNRSGEDCPYKVINSNAVDSGIRMAVIGGNDWQLLTEVENSFILYNEDRLTLMLKDPKAKRPVQNPRVAVATKYESSASPVFVFPGDKQTAFELTGDYLTVWEACNGLTNKAEVITRVNADIYQQMLGDQLIIELDD